MPIIWWNPWTAWKVWDNEGWALDSILWLNSILNQWAEEEEDNQDLKDIFLSWWVIEPSLWIGSGNRVWTFWKIYNIENSNLPESLKQAALSWNALWKSNFDKITDAYFWFTNAEKNRKANENARINSSLSWNVELANIENNLWTWDLSWLSTEETFLDKRLIEWAQNKKDANYLEQAKQALIASNPFWLTKYTASKVGEWFKHESDYWMPTFDSEIHWMANPKQLLSNMFEYEWDKVWYQWIISTLAEAKTALESWEIDQKYYDSLYNAAVEDLTPYYDKKFWVNDNMRRAWWLNHYLDSAIDWEIKNADIEWRLDEAYPERAFEREWNQIRVNDFQKQAMTAFTEALNKTKSSTYDKQLYDNAYAVATNIAQRLNNSINYLGSIMRDMIARNWWDISKIEWRDKEIYQDALRTIQAYEQFKDNYIELIAKAPSFKDPETWRVLIPDIIDWQTPHDILFKWTEDLLYKDSDFATRWDEKHVSPIDVIENMVASISYDYTMAHPWRNWYKVPWANLQYGWWLLWWNLTEMEQQLLWWLWVWIYNTVATEASELSYAYLDQDFTDYITLNSHTYNSSRTIQSWAAWSMEYLPEIWWAYGEVLIWNAISEAARATDTMRVFRSQWLRRTLSQAMRYAWWDESSKLPSVWSRFKNVLNNIPKVTDDIIKNWWVKVYKWWEVVTESLDDVKATKRLVNNLLYDLWAIEAPMDLYFDSRFADADIEQGSDVSFIWSLWWTILWTYLPWLSRTWLFKDSKLIARALMWKDAGNALKQWWEWWWAFNLMKLSENSKYNPLDAMAKAQFWLNSSKLASFQELQQMNWVMSDIVNAFTEVYKSLKPWMKNITDESVKHMIWQYMSQIFWADSQMARRIWQLVADKRANPADIYKYALQLRWNVWIWPWRSAIALADNPAGKFVNFYDEALDTMPIFREWWFSRALREWFTRYELKYLKEHWKEWAVLENFKKNKDWRYIFTTDWLERASKDIDAMSMDIPIISKVSDSSETFDKLMRNSNIKNISDETLTEITQSWAYDTLSNALWSISWICGLDWV